MRTANTIVLVALALAAAGCGGDADKREKPAANQARQNGADARLAQASLLTIDDVPTGWTAEDDDGDSASTSECPEIKAARASRSGSARAPTLAENGDKTVQHSVMVFPTAVDAKAAHVGMASAETRRCLGKELPTSLGDDLAKEGVTVGDVTTGRVSGRAGRRGRWGFSLLCRTHRGGTNDSRRRGRRLRPSRTGR